MNSKFKPLEKINIKDRNTLSSYNKETQFHLNTC